MDNKSRLTEDDKRNHASPQEWEGTVTAREDTATLREDAASVREDAVGLREETSTLREAREGAVSAREDTATLREGAAHVRDVAAGQREETSTLREEREGTVTAREDTATLREDAAHVREVAAGQREETSTLREETATLREDAASVREEAAQDDLRDSRVMLAQTGRLAKVGGWQLDADTQTLIWTEEVYAIHEVDPATKPTVAEAIQFYAPESRPVITAAVQAAINAGTSFDLELPLLTARGRYIWVRALGIAERLGGKTIRVYGALQDITDRKRAEEALHVNERLLSESQRLGHVGSWFWDLAGPFQWSEETYRIYGVSPHTFTPTPESLLSLIHPDDRTAMQSWLAAFTAGEEHELEFRTERLDGTVRVLLGRGEAVEGVGNRLAHMAGTVQDITERKRAEEAVRMSEARHRTIVQTAMDGFWMFDMGGRLLDVNEAYCRMSGYTARELLALRISDLDASESAADASAHFAKIVAEGGDRFETRHRRKDGTLFDVEVSAQYQASDGGRLVGFLRDITARKRAEAEKVKLEAQLRQAQKMESVGRLAGGVAHDFNNMLGVILGHAELALAQVAPTQPLHDDLLAIHAAASRSADLTRQLLAFARKQTIAPKVLDLNAAVEAMLGLLRRLIGEDIDLRVAAGRESVADQGRPIPDRPDSGQPLRQRSRRHRGCG